MAPRHVVIEGNIASGKTTLLNALRPLAPPTWDFFPEPVELWRDFRGHNLLEMMYQEPEKYSYQFQNLALFTKIEQLDGKLVKPINIVERSIAAQSKVFIPLLQSNGNLTDLEYKLLDYEFQQFENKPEFKPDLYLWLDIKPQKCFKRIQGRSRIEERDVPLEYLRQMDVLYGRWLMITEREVPVIRITDPYPPTVLQTITEFFTESE